MLGSVWGWRGDHRISNANTTSCRRWRLPQRRPPTRTLSSWLDGASVCIQTGTTTEFNLADFFRVNGISYEPVPIETNAEARAAYEAERCDVYTTDASGLAATQTTFENPSDRMVFPEIVSKEPLGPLVRQGNDQWADIARWTLKPHSLNLEAYDPYLTSEGRFFLISANLRQEIVSLT